MTGRAVCIAIQSIVQFIKYLCQKMSGSGSKACSLCCREASAWAVSVCDHPSCLTCYARLRVLCGQKECPVCREQLELVSVCVLEGEIDGWGLCV